jgi:hypothetical protein
MRGWQLLLLYVAISALVFVAHGPQPTISIDHIAYFKVADEIRASHPQHYHWRSVSTVRPYAVIMAYLFDFTGNRVRSLKILLPAMTVAYLFSAEIFFLRFSTKHWIAVFLALLGAIHVSFCSVFWGVTDFEASLNRTL